jgi:hypothetical protein
VLVIYLILMNEEGLSGMIIETSFGGIILVIVVSVSVGKVDYQHLPL